MTAPEQLIARYESLHAEAVKDHPNSGAMWEAKKKLADFLIKNSGEILDRIQDQRRALAREKVDEMWRTHPSSV